MPTTTTTITTIQAKTKIPLFLYFVWNAFWFSLLWAFSLGDCNSMFGSFFMLSRLFFECWFSSANFTHPGNPHHFSICFYHVTTKIDVRYANSSIPSSEQMKTKKKKKKKNNEMNNMQLVKARYNIIQPNRTMSGAYMGELKHVIGYNLGTKLRVLSWVT